MTRTVRWIGARIEHPIDLPALVGALSRLLVALALVVALFVLSRRLDDQDALAACRSQLAAALDDAEVDRHSADDQVTLAIGQEVGVEIPPGVDVLPLDEAARRLADAEEALTEARDARLAFEANPSPAHCQEAP